VRRNSSAIRSPFFSRSEHRIRAATNATSVPAVILHLLEIETTGSTDQEKNRSPGPSDRRRFPSRPPGRDIEHPDVRRVDAPRIPVEVPGAHRVRPALHQFAESLAFVRRFRRARGRRPGSRGVVRFTYSSKSGQISVTLRNKRARSSPWTVWARARKTSSFI